MRYTDLIFDLYGTLVDIHTEETDLAWEKTALYLGYYGVHYTGAALKTDYESEMAKRESAAGQSYEMFPDIPFDAVLAELIRKKGVTEDADTIALNAAQVFRVTATEYIRLYEHVPQALDALKQRGCRLWLLSNAQRAFTAYELQHLGLGAQFDGIYLSSDYQCRKPDVRFYRALMADHGLDPAGCLMIGNDRETDIAGAKACGMSTLYMHTNLTPADQAVAKPDTLPCRSQGQMHFEYEGSDWQQLANLLLQL